MSGYVPERSLAYPANHLCFDVPLAVYEAVLAATEEAASAGKPTDWMHIRSTGEGARVIEFSGALVLPPLESPSTPTHPIVPRGTTRPVLVGGFRSRRMDEGWKYDRNMLVQVTQRYRGLRGRLGKRAIRFTSWVTQSKEPPFGPHED